MSKYNPKVKKGVATTLFAAAVLTVGSGCSTLDTSLIQDNIGTAMTDVLTSQGTVLGEQATGFALNRAISAAGNLINGEDCESESASQSGQSNGSATGTSGRKTECSTDGESNQSERDRERLGSEIAREEVRICMAQRRAELEGVKPMTSECRTIIQNNR